MMEHVRSPTAWIGELMDFVNPIALRLMGPNINRDTVRNVFKAGLQPTRVEDLGLGGIYIIVECQISAN
jgi:hypothetical protein